MPTSHSTSSTAPSGSEKKPDDLPYRFVTKTSRTGPLLVSAVLLLGLLIGGYLLWKTSQQDDGAARLQSQQQRNVDLARQKDAFQALLAAEPCDVARQLGVPTPTVPVASAAPATSATTEGATAQASSVPVPGVSAQPTLLVDANSQRAENAAVLVLNVLTNGGLAVGTGFFVAPGVVVTNRHVVEDKSNRLLVINEFLQGLVPAKIIAMSQDTNRDYAVLQVQMKEPERSPVLALRFDAKRTEKVSAWGYPSAVSQSDPKFQAMLQGNGKAIPEIIYSEGVISAVLDRKPPLLAHTTPLSPGNSGGPLMDSNGYVVGINTLISLDEKSYRQTSLSLAARDLANFLQSAGVTPILAPNPVFPSPAPSVGQPAVQSPDQSVVQKDKP